MALVGSYLFDVITGCIGLEIEALNYNIFKKKTSPAYILGEIMEKDSLKIYSHNGIIGNLIALVCGIAIMVIGVVAGISIQNGLAVIVLCLLGGSVLVAISVIAMVYLLKGKIIIDDKSIVCYNHHGFSKSINIDDLQRIVVYQVKRLGGKISRIILDDGTFDEDGEPRRIISDKFMESPTWIFLEYSNKRLELLKNKFSNIKIETMDKLLN